MFKKFLFLLALIFWMIPTNAYADGIIPVICLLEEFDFCSNMRTIREYNIINESDILVKTFEKGNFGITEYSLEKTSPIAIKRYEKGNFGITEYSLEKHSPSAIKRYEILH